MLKKSHIKRRSRLINLFLIGFITILTISMFSLITLAMKDETAKPVAKPEKIVTPAKVLVNTAESGIPNINIVTETSTDASAPFVIQYPQTLHSSRNKAISAYIEEAKKSYLIKQQKSGTKGNLTISYDIFTHSTGDYSVVLVNNRSIDGTEQHVGIETFHFNLETGEDLLITDVLQAEQLTSLTTIVRDQLTANETTSENYSAEEIQSLIGPDWTNYANFSLGEEAITFYFGEKESGMGATHPIEVTLPLNKVNLLLSEKYQTPIEEQPIEVPDANVKKIALTFDDGPHPQTTMQILETLEKYDAKATFFMLGNMVQQYPQLAKKVVEQGHEVGNHSWNHHDLTKLSPASIQQEINDTSLIIESTIGQKATAFRPPYGAANETVRSQTNLPIVLWDVDTEDWKYRDSEMLLPTIKSAARNNSIVLMHDIHQSTANGLDAVLAYLQSEGYTFVTVSELTNRGPQNNDKQTRR